MAALHERGDQLLPWALRPRKGEINSRAMVAAVDVGGPVNQEMELAICVVAPPPENRTLAILEAQDDVNRFICSVCGRGFASSRAMGGHKAHHAMSERRRGLVEEGGGGAGEGAVVNERPLQQPRRRRRYCGARRRCERCERTFVNGQGLGGHKLHCKGGPPPPADAPVEIDGGGGDGRVIHGFDLNELPPPEPEEELLALPWYGNGAPAEL